MTTKKLSYKGYLFLLNRIGYWIIKNNYTIVKKDITINNKKKTYSEIIKVIKDNGSKYGKNEYVGRLIENHIGKGGKLPSYVKGSSNKTKYSKSSYKSMVSRVKSYRKKHGANPKTVKGEYTKYVNKCENPYTSSPVYTSQGVGKLGQITSHHCGPCSVHQALRKFGITKYSQSKIGEIAGTTSSGTDPSSLMTAIEYIGRKEGVSFKVERRYLSDFGDTTNEQFKALAKLMCKKNIFIFFHLGYQDSGEVASGTVFGHYEAFDKIDVSEKKIRILNSLGSRSGSGYYGHLQWRSFSLQKKYINNKNGVPSVWIITKK